MKQKWSILIGACLVSAMSLILSPLAGAAEDKLPKPKDRWIQVRTANFTLFSNAPEKVTIKAGVNLEQLRDHTMIPLSQLMAIDHSSPEYNEDNRRGVFYAQSWALTHLLVIGRPDGATRTGVYYGLLQQGIDPNEAFQTAFAISYKELEAQLRKYLNSRRFTYQNMPISKAIQHASTVTEMSYPEVLYRLGTLLSDLGPDRYPSAAEHFNTSLEFDQASPKPGPCSGPHTAGMTTRPNWASKPWNTPTAYCPSAATSATT